MNKNGYASIVALLIAVGFLVVGTSTYFYFHQNQATHNPSITQNYLSATTSNIGLSASVGPNKILAKSSEGEQGIAYLESGTVWALKNDLDKKYKLVETTDSIASFHISTFGDEIYWVTNKGELWKKNTDGKLQPLITVLNDMSEIQDTKGGEMSADGTYVGAEKFTYLKGQVGYFYVSPSGKYIVYAAIEHYTSCCMGHNDFPVYSFWSMRSDGTQKTKMLNPDSRLLKFEGWLPDDAGIMYLTHEVDEPTTGNGFYKISFDGKNDYKGTNYIIPQVTPCVSQFPGTAPVFSPDGKKVAFYNYMDGVSLWDADGTHEKRLVTTEQFAGLENPFYFDIGWSDDSQSLAVRTGPAITIFDNLGKQINAVTLPEDTKLAATIYSQDNKYIAETYEKDGKMFIAIVSLATGSVHEFDITDTESSRDIPNNFYPKTYLQFSSSNGKLYYISTRVRVGGEPSPPQTLWSLDTITGEKQKLSDNASLVQEF